MHQIRMAGLPDPVREFKAILGRRFRWDFAWPEHKLLVEVQGGIWQRGGHSTGKGITRDAEKLNLASLAGYRSLAFTADQIRGGQALAWLQQFFREAA